MTMVSKLLKVCANTESSAVAINLAARYAGMMMLTAGDSVLNWFAITVFFVEVMNCFLFSDSILRHCLWRLGYPQNPHRPVSSHQRVAQVGLIGLGHDADDKRGAQINS